MADLLDPIVDQWYLRADTGQHFLVTSYDESDGTIEVQTAEGDLDELDKEGWQAASVQLAEPPQDWTESFDSELAGDDDLQDDRLDAEGGVKPDDAPE